MQRSASQRGRPDRLVGQAKTVCRQQRAAHEKGRVRLVRRNRPVCFAFQEVSFLKGLLKEPAKLDYFLPAFLRLVFLVFLLVDFLAFLRVAFFLVLFLAFLRVAFFFLTIALWLLP